MQRRYIIIVIDRLNFWQLRGPTGAPGKTGGPVFVAFQTGPKVHICVLAFRLSLRLGGLAILRYVFPRASSLLSRERTNFSVLSDRGGVADGWAATSAPILLASSITE